MTVKCGRKEFDLTEEDEIMYNGACYQIITREIGTAFNKYYPRIADGVAKKLLKNGDIIFKCKRRYTICVCDIYKIKETV